MTAQHVVGLLMIVVGSVGFMITVIRPRIAVKRLQHMLDDVRNHERRRPKKGS